MNKMSENSDLVNVESNRQARATWENKAVGSQRADAEKGSQEYFAQIKNYRYGYETPFIPSVFMFADLHGKSVLEIGVGNGIDAVEMIKQGADYSGIDITKNHIDLTKKNICYEFPAQCEKYTNKIYEADLLEKKFANRFDVVYSFGVLHHIQHEAAYLAKIRDILAKDGELRFAVYAKYSFFNIWLLFTWIIKNRMRNTFFDWQSHVAEGSELGNPVVIKVRSKKRVERMLKDSGFQVIRYSRNGFVQGYIPFLGKYLKPDGKVLSFFGKYLGWYHCFICTPKS